MDTANILFLLITINVVSDGAWLPPGLRGDLPPWGAPVPPPWAIPPPSAVFRRPMDAMVDLTNDLGVAILQDTSHSRSNFAFSPYGLASVLVVLYEGAMGESARQIHMAGKFPWDRDITRIGFRDIHRHLRSYFSHEGYLSGITLNKEKSSLMGEYKRILRFYGYDVDVEPPKVTAPTTEKPLDQVPLITKPLEVPARPTVITSIPTTIGSQVTLNSSLFPGKESVDDVTLTEQTLLFPTTEKPATTQQDKSTFSNMLTESNKPSASVSTILPEEVTQPANDIVSTSSSNTENIATQTEIMSSNPNSIPTETTTRNVLDNGMLVPQSSQLDPLLPTAAPSPTATSQMQGAMDSQASEKPSEGVTSVILEMSTKQTTQMPGMKSTPEVMNTAFKSDTNMPKETPITTVKPISPIVTDLIESRVDEDVDKLTTGMMPSNANVTSVTEESIVTSEVTESQNEAETASSTKVDSYTSGGTAFNKRNQPTTESVENVMTTETLDSPQSRNGDEGEMPFSTNDDQSIGSKITPPSTMLDEKLTTTENDFTGSGNLEKDESSTMVVDTPTTIAMASNTKEQFTTISNDKSMITESNIRENDVSTPVTSSSTKQETTTMFGEISTTTENGYSQESTESIVTTENAKPVVTIDSRNMKNQETASSTNIDQWATIAVPLSPKEQLTSLSDENSMITETPKETVFIQSRIAEEDLTSSTSSEKSTPTTVEPSTEKILLESRTFNSDDTTTQDSLSKTTVVSDGSQYPMTDEISSTNQFITKSYNDFSVTETTVNNPTIGSQDLVTDDESSTNEVKTDSTSTTQTESTTRRAPITLSFRPRTKISSAVRETTDIPTSAPLSEKLFKRSPDSFEIRTLDEYFLSSDVTNKAMQPPLKTYVLTSNEQLIPKTLDEYLLSSDDANKAMQPPLKTFVLPPNEQLIPKTLDEYLLSSDAANKAMQPPLKTFVLSSDEQLIPKTLDEYLLRSDVANKAIQPPLKTLVLHTNKKFVPKTLDEFLMLRDDGKKIEEEEEFMPKTLEEYFLSRKREKAIQFKTDLDFKTAKYRRRARTIADMLHIPSVPDLSLQLQNGMFDSHVSRKAELYRPLPRQPFLVDATSELPVPVMTYTNVFPFAYIPRLHSTAMEFPLDDERYKLLIILPVEKRGLRQLTYDLGIVTLRGVLESLRPSRVRATVPTFMVEGFVILTPALQRLGIWNVFDPRRANLTGMSEDPELYVRNVEQSVTVVIRNYVEILDIQTRTMAARGPEHEFRATHPFLYFVLDTETNVSLMAGRMLDPLNSRIY